jgi:hypothetical protein
MRLHPALDLELNMAVGIANADPADFDHGQTTPVRQQLWPSGGSRAALAA